LPQESILDQKTIEGRRLSGQDTSRLRATQNNPSGFHQVETFGNPLADSFGFRVPSWQSLGRPHSLDKVGRKAPQPLGDSEAGYAVDFAVDLPISQAVQLPHQLQG
jgi:hypothetical protein